MAPLQLQPVFVTEVRDLIQRQNTNWQLCTGPSGMYQLSILVCQPAKQMRNYGEKRTEAKQIFLFFLLLHAENEVVQETKKRYHKDSYHGYHGSDLKSYQALSRRKRSVGMYPL